MSDKQRVLIADKLPPAALEILEQEPEIEADVRLGLSPDELKDAVGDYHGIIIRSGTKLTADVIGKAGKLIIERPDGGIQAVHRRHTSKGGISQRLRHHDRPDRESGSTVGEGEVTGSVHDAGHARHQPPQTGRGFRRTQGHGAALLLSGWGLGEAHDSRRICTAQP